MTKSIIATILPTILCLACQRNELENPGIKVTRSGIDRWTGLISNQGFGSSVAGSTHGTWAGAPHGETGRIYCLSDDGAQAVLEGGGRLGTHLIPWKEDFIAAAPLANDGRGAILNADNQALAEGPSAMGIAMWTNGSKWIAAHATGWLDSNGDTGDAQSRPTSVISTGQGVATGSALGTHAMQINARTIERIEPQDFAGYSMAAGDIDGDGNQEWIVGAPGLNRVEIRDFDGTVRHLIVGPPGRFGAALAVGDVTGDQQPDLIVGSPAAGDSIEGKVYLYEGPDLDAITEWRGDEPGHQLGFSVAVADGAILVGGPGSAEQLGVVWRIRL